MRRDERTEDQKGEGVAISQVEPATVNDASINQTESSVAIPKIQVNSILVKINGLTPLLTNRFSEEKIKQIEDKQTKKARPQQAARVPEEEFRQALHVINEKENRYGYPAIGIKKCLVAAGGRFTDAKMTELRGVLNIAGNVIEIKGSPPVMRTDWVNLKKVTSLAYRPMFEKWEMEVPVLHNARILSEEEVINLFSVAGFSIGLGCWRPENNGTFGTFDVKGYTKWLL